MHDRIFAGSNLLLCLLLAVLAWAYQAPFTYEPVGPRAFPLLLLLLITAALLYLLCKPLSRQKVQEEPALDRHVSRKIVLCVAALLVYSALFEVMGFILSSVLFAVAMARLYGASWLQSGIGGGLIAVGLYLLFDYGLDVPLPLGMLAALGN